MPLLPLSKRSTLLRCGARQNADYVVPVRVTVSNPNKRRLDLVQVLLLPGSVDVIDQRNACDNGLTTLNFPAIEPGGHVTTDFFIVAGGAANATLNDQTHPLGCLGLQSVQAAPGPLIWTTFKPNRQAALDGGHCRPRSQASSRMRRRSSATTTTRILHVH